MNIQIHPETTVLNSYVFRAADRMRIDGCTHAIAREGMQAVAAGSGYRQAFAEAAKAGKESVVIISAS